MEKTKLEQPVPFEDIYFRRSEGGPSVVVLEKPVPMSDANYRHVRQVVDQEKTLSFIQLTEIHSAPAVEVECEETVGFKAIEGVEAESAGESLDFTTSAGFLEITGYNFNKTIDFVPLVKDEDDMTSDLDTYMATQQSIKAYADAYMAGVVITNLDGGTFLASEATDLWKFIHMNDHCDGGTFVITYESALYLDGGTFT